MQQRKSTKQMQYIHHLPTWYTSTEFPKNLVFNLEVKINVWYRDRKVQKKYQFVLTKKN
jgi:hypothetical protein